jgi:hypothetical protein
VLGCYRTEDRPGILPARIGTKGLLGQSAACIASQQGIREPSEAAFFARVMAMTQPKHAAAYHFQNDFDKLSATLRCLGGVGAIHYSSTKTDTYELPPDLVHLIEAE